MSKIDCILNKSIWLLHETKKMSQLDYLSRIDGEYTAWYFWLKDIKGVYELKLKETVEMESVEKSFFYVKYYPDLEDHCFDTFSCAEQFLRLSDFFENTDVQIDSEIDLCPCCGTNQHEHNHIDVFMEKRSKGIPKLLQRKLLSPELFTIGEIEFEIHKDKLTFVKLTTANKLLRYAVDGIQFTDNNGNIREIVKPHELDRAIAGFSLCLPFYKFLLNKMLGILLFKPIKRTITKSLGKAFFDFGNSNLQEKSSKKVKKITITTLF